MVGNVARADGSDEWVRTGSHVLIGARARRARNELSALAQSSLENAAAEGIFDQPIRGTLPINVVGLQAGSANVRFPHRVTGMRHRDDSSSEDLAEATAVRGKVGEGKVEHAPTLERQRGEKRELDTSVDQAVIEAFLLRLDDRIVELMPGLARLVGPAPLHELDRRSTNCLLRSDLLIWERIVDLTPGEILDLPHAGQLTLRRLLSWCHSHAEPILVVPADPGQLLAAGIQSEELIGGAEAAMPPQLLQDLGIASRWWKTYRGADSTFESLAELLHAEEADLPSDVWEAVRSIAAADLPGNENLLRGDSDVEDEVQRSCGDDQAWRVLHARSGVKGRDLPTLADLGSELGLSRERVRQIEKRERHKLEVAVSSTQSLESIRWRVHTITQELAKGVPMNSLGACRVLEDESLVGRLALWLAGPYEQRGGWLAMSGEDPEGQLSGAVLGLPGPVFSLDELSSALLDIGIPLSVLDEVLRSLEYIRYVDGAWVRWHGSIPDKAAVVLALLCDPASAEEILSHFRVTRSVASVRNALALDDRFVRSNKTEWALAEWGLEEYSGIAEEIIERIERDGGTTNLSGLVEELVSFFDVSAASVRSYASTPGFVIEDGYVRVCRPEEIEDVSRDLSSTKGVYRPAAGEIVARFEVDQDMLRGSGRSIDIGLASQLGLRPGGRLVFSSGYQDISVTWRTMSPGGPSRGSLASSAKALNASSGSELVVHFYAEQGVATVDSVDDSVTGVERLGALTGISVDGDVAADLAAAMNVSRGDLRATLRRRGENDLVELLPPPTGERLTGEVADLAAFLDAL